MGFMEGHSDAAKVFNAHPLFVIAPAHDYLGPTRLIHPVSQSTW